MQIKRAKTDDIVSIGWHNPERAEANNLLTLYQLSTGKSKEDVLKDVEGLNWGGFKPLLADALIAHLEPIQNRCTADAAGRAVVWCLGSHSL